MTRAATDPQSQQQTIAHHLLIAGTGRTGTSALVRFLTAAGLETHATLRGADSLWDEHAQAGLEDIPLSAITPNMPYVVKSPWSYQVIQELIDDPAIALDGVIVPIRDLVEATASRTIRQLQAVHQARPWMTRTNTTWEQWASTPGGMIFSLNPIDEARLLAVGFHRLVERLVQSDIPLIFLAFPRFILDADYLYRKLAPLLPQVSAEGAMRAHAATFAADKIRVGHELGSERPPADEILGPAFEALDLAALKREVNRLRTALNNSIAQCDVLVRERDALRTRLDGLAADGALLGEEVRLLRASRSWRLTRPLRLLSATIRGAPRPD